MVNHKYLEKAEILIEALPYIQRFNRKIIVVKYGGSAMLDEDLKKQVIQDVTLLKLVGFKPIIVHGGGKEISRWVGKVGKEPEFINGLRKTDAETMETELKKLGFLDNASFYYITPIEAYQESYGAFVSVMEKYGYSVDKTYSGKSALIKVTKWDIGR